MEFNKQRLSIEEARQIDIVDYLSKLGYQPAKIRGIDYWYKSPLREEKTPSFKVNRKLNRWYDHGIGKGGNIIDFVIEYHNCTISELLQQLAENFSFHQASLPHSSEQLNGSHESKLKIVKEGTLSSFALLQYLQMRSIPIDVAERFCKELKYELNGKMYFGIGVRNNSGGYEIRTPYFKGSSSPKDITTFNNGAKEIAVFEGFIDFLSFMAIHKNELQNQSDYLILNSVGFFEKSRTVMEQHDAIRLYLDRDITGQNCSGYALTLSNKYKDESHLYQNYKDVNDWLINFGKGQMKNPRCKI